MSTAEAQTATQGEPKNKSIEPRHLNILLIEDQHSYAELVEAALEDRFSCNITHAATYQEAEQRLKQPNQFFIAISDLNLPDADDGSILDLLKTHKIPTIAMTASFSEETRHKVLNSGVIDYVLKESAFDIDYICGLIERVYKNQCISVLILDDSSTYRAVISSMLKTQQLTVHTAKDGLEGLALLEQHPEICMALVDHEMPQMNGFTFIRKARAKLGKDQLALIGISASDGEKLTARFLKAGANDFIQKPLSHESLLCRVNQNLEMIEKIQTAQNLSYKDYLSGLYNRRYFFEKGEKIHQEAIAAKTSLNVMMLDIDHFKKINDGYGHDAGDAVIIQLSNLLETHFAQDLVARVGGEEFAVINQSKSAIDFYSAVENFRKTVAKQNLAWQNSEIIYTCSIGLTQASGLSIEASLKAADLCLYEAKNAGRNQVWCAQS